MNVAFDEPDSGEDESRGDGQAEESFFNHIIGKRDFRPASHEEIMCICLANKVVNNQSDKSLADAYRMFNVFLTDRRDKLPTHHRNVKAFLRKKCVLPRKLIVYCPGCQMTAHESEDDAVKDVMCPHCAKNLEYDAKVEQCSFWYIPLGPQIKNFLENGKLPKLIRETSKMPRLVASGSMHDHLQFPDSLDIYVGCDAAPITKRSGITVYPSVFFFNQISPCDQLAFPLLCTCFVGDTRKCPPAEIMFAKVNEELDFLSENGIEWNDGGMVRRTRVFMTMSKCDAKQMSEMMNINAPNGRYSCFFCNVKGMDVRTVRGGSKIVFPDPVHRDDVASKRSEASYLDLSRKANETRVQTGEVDIMKTEGVKGYPIFYARANFDAVVSSVPDLLHVVFEGVVDRLLAKMTGTRGKPYSFLPRGSTWTSKSDRYN